MPDPLIFLQSLTQGVSVDAYRKNALLSVYDKEGIVEFAWGLIDLGWNLFSSGGTAKVLQEAGLAVTDIGTIVGPPILGHRVVTLSRELHAGLLARNTPEDLAELQRIGAPYFDLVCVDLYPLQAETEREGATMESVIEKTDIGGPTLLRSGAKGRRLVISNRESRELVLRHLQEGTGDDPDLRHMFAMEAERLVSRYCDISVRFLDSHFETLPSVS
ncbi:MAG: hypothetical protein AAB407_03760 [Patescibacteria group bacterium]